MASITTELVETGAKRDGRGRRIVTAMERAALLFAYQRSGLTQRAFAQREGVKYSTLTAWLQGRRQGGRPGRKIHFAEMPVTPAPALAGLAVQLPDGVVIRGGSVREIAELVRVLRN